MLEFMKQPWPWYLAGPVIGLMVPLAMLIGNKRFGVSSSLRHICAACLPGKVEFFRYNWKKERWSLFFVLGIIIGGFLGDRLLVDYDRVDISETTLRELKELGLTNFSGFMPKEIFSWGHLLSLQGLIFIALGGFMVGFGARWAGGCTSGHSITGISNLQLVSVIATLAFFAGGLFVTHIVYPILF
jgi:uncharacterized membrane protein YedE/YeeE